MQQGPFHRVETPTQTSEHARLQKASREMWGRAARGSGLLSVKAYPGRLPSRRGVEFMTDVDPLSGSAPNEARWYYGTCAGVQLRQQNGEDFACISLTSFSNMQP